MKIAVLEHFTSLAGVRRDDPRAAEGRAMRDAVVADLARLPGVRAIAVERRASFRAALRAADAALVVAPEQDGILERLSRSVERAGTILLGPSASAVALAADKLRTARCLAAAGVVTPRTETVPFRSARRRLAARTAPFVLKPRDGCGCRGVVLVRRPAEIAAAVRTVRAATRRDDCLVQDYVEGEPASVSVIASGACLDLGLNRQAMRPGRTPAYLGGETFWAHPAAPRAAQAARAAVAALADAARGVRGYLGVDLVLGQDGATVIEVNPRLTTSYVGLRRSLRENLAGLILDAAAGRTLPGSVTQVGRCRFLADGAFRMLPAAGGPGWPTTSAGTSAAFI